MKKVMVFLLVSLLMVFAGCGEKKSAEGETGTDVRTEFQKNSTLEKIIKDKKIRVGLEAGYLPFEFTNDKGEIIGFDVDLATLMAKELGVELEIVNTSWDGIIPGLQVGKYDIIMSGMTRTLERALAVSFSDPYYSTGQVLMIRKGETRFKDFKDFNAEGLKIGTKLGTTSDFAVDRLLKRSENVKYKTEADAALALRQSKVDAMVYDKPFIEDYTEQNQDVVMIPELFTSEYFGFATKKADPDFTAWLNLFIAEIKANGTYEELYNKWFIDKEYKNKQ